MHADHRQFDKSECLSEVLTVYIILERGHLSNAGQFQGILKLPE